MKKIICLLIALVMLCTAFVGCKKEDENENGTYVPPVNDPYEKDDLPSLNYGGDTLTVLYWEDNFHDEFNITEPSDDMVSNAVYNRDRAVKQRLNIQLDYIGTPGWETAPFVAFLNTDVFSGACEYDIACSASITVASCATSNLCEDLLDYDYINFDKPWWPEALTEEATINRKLYFASGDISTSYLYEMYINFYNLDMVQEYKLTDDFTQLALAGKWTWDKFYEFSNAVGYNEKNGDNIPSNGDIFGFITETGAIDCAFYSADLHMFSHDRTGGISVDESCFGLKADGFVADLNDFIHRSGSVFYTVPTSEHNDDANDTQKSSKWMFSRGEALFIFGRAIAAKDVFSKAEGLRYGILPIPKYDEEQEQYVSTLTNQFTLYSISIGSHDPEMASAAIECMASESYRQVTPVLFETIMKLRYAPSAASAQIYDIVRATTTFDLSRIFHRALESVPEWVFKKAIENDESWGAKATTQTRQLNNLIEDIIMSAFTGK